MKGQHGKNPGLETKPGDRGDASCAKGVAGVAANKSPDMPTNLRSKASKGYESAPSGGFAGNVRR